MSVAQAHPPMTLRITSAAALSVCLLSGCVVFPRVTRVPSRGTVHEIRSGAAVANTEVMIVTSHASRDRCNEEVLYTHRVTTDAQGRWRAPGARALTLVLFGGPTYCQRYQLSEGNNSLPVGPLKERNEVLTAQSGRLRLTARELPMPSLPSLLPIGGVVGSMGQGAGLYVGAIWFVAPRPLLLGLRAQIQPGIWGGSASLGLDYFPGGAAGAALPFGIDLSVRAFRLWRRDRPGETRWGPEIGMSFLLVRLTLAVMAHADGTLHGQAIEPWAGVAWPFVGLL